MSIVIFGKPFFKTKLEKRRDALRKAYSDIADEYEEYESEHGENLYTERLQNKQQKVADELDKIGWSQPWHKKYNLQEE